MVGLPSGVDGRRFGRLVPGQPVASGPPNPLAEGSVFVARGDVPIPGRESHRVVDALTASSGGRSSSAMRLSMITIAVILAFGQFLKSCTDVWIMPMPQVMVQMTSLSDQQVIDEELD